MSASIDITGQIYGRLTVINEILPRQYPKKWKCICTCGEFTIVIQNNLRRGITKSCGCYHKELQKPHGDAIVGKRARLYNIWTGMRQRCSNSKASHYELYGGRGISVCEEWQDYKTFKSWAISHNYQNNLSIDRWPNNDGDYEPNNCRWATQSEQLNNRST